MPRFIVYGAGAVGGVVGSRLFEHGHEVVLIARGAHREAIAQEGLRFESPDGVLVQAIEIAALPEEIAWRGDDVVLMSVKGQDMADALERLEDAAGSAVTVACMQNGVENERLALRRFARVYSIVVQLPATHLEPGVVVAHSSPITGSLDIGRYPDGVDERSEQIAATFTDCGFASQPRADLSRWKYAKFLRNVANAVDALFHPGDGAPEVERRAVAEAVAALEAAGIDYVGEAEYDERHRRLITIKPVAGRARGGGSTWQSLARASGGIEVDQLNGEVVLLGRLHGIPTPVNELLRELARADARAGVAPGTHTEAEFLATLAGR